MTPTSVPTSPNGGMRRAIGMGDLIALNDEIAALTRAGLPLGRGLVGVGEDLPGRLGGIARDLGQRLERGESLGEALEAERARVPATYRAVVEAGMRSGRLPEALEGLAVFARSYVELRRAIGLALLYPLIVLTVGYGLFVLFVVELAPRLMEAFGAMRVPVASPLRAMRDLGGSVAVWGPIVPLILAAVGLAWWWSGRASRYRPGGVPPAMRWVPGLRQIASGASAAQFADWLALLMEHDVPWAESVLLAAEATGDDRLVATASRIADGARRGESIGETLRDVEGLPPLLGWLMGAGHDREALVRALRHAAETYRRRAARRTAALRTTLPTVLLLGIGATATLLYTSALFAPWTALLRGLTRLH